MTYCSICNEVVYIAIDDAAGIALHRYFRHGPVAERLARWGISALVAIFVPKLVQELRRGLE